jgi:tetratricopeptide (TPR) repeat protein
MLHNRRKKSKVASGSTLGRACCGLCIGFIALIEPEIAAADSCGRKQVELKAALMDKHKTQFDKSAKHLATIEGQLDKLCDYGQTVGIALWNRTINELVASVNACSDPISVAVLRAQRRNFENYKRSVADDCKNSAALRTDPNDASAFYNRGVAYSAKGDKDRAIADYSEAIRLDPGYALAFNQRGNAHSAKGDNDRAIADYSDAIRLDPKYGGNASLANGDNDRDIAYDTEAIRLDPKDASAFAHRGLAYFFKGEYDLCIRDSEEAIRLDSKNVSAFNNRGLAYLQKGDLDRALADLNEAIRLDPKLAAVYRNRGNGYLQKGDLDRALADLDEAIKLDPQQKPAYAYRGVVHEKKGRRENAIADYRKALSLPVDKFYAVGQRAHETARTRLAALTAPPATITPLAAPAGDPGRRIALVIGNSNYKAVAALPNPQRDAQSVAQALRSVGFETVKFETDLPRDRLIDSLRTFAAEAEKADWAVVYFAGHGIELGATGGLGGANYLVPVDARLETDRAIEFETVPLGHVITAVEGARKLRLIILDACRDNPFARQMKRTVASRSVGRGLARIEPDGGVLVAYAAKHGEVALDGGGHNSPFVAALVNRLPTPGVEIGKLFRLVRDDVLAATDRKQEPFVYGSLPGEDFFFVTGR